MIADALAAASLLVTALSLVAVVVIGRRTIEVTKEATAATIEATKATKANLEVAKQAAVATERSVAASEQALQAATYANALMKHDARVRRIEAVLGVAVEMRRVWNEDYFKWAKHAVNLNPGTAEHRQRVHLCFLLESRLAPFADEELPKARAIGREVNWRNVDLDDAIDEARQLLKQEMESFS